MKYVKLLAGKLKAIIDRIFDFFIRHPYFFVIFLLSFAYSFYSNKEYLPASIYIALSIFIVSTFVIFRNIESKLDQIVKMTVFMIIIFTLITFLSSAIAKLLIPKNFYFGSLDAWIQFAGSILGGSLTMLALIYTIDNEDEKRKDDRLFSLMPIIECRPLEGKNQYTALTSIDKFELKNLSSNIALNIRMISNTHDFVKQEEDHRYTCTDTVKYEFKGYNIPSILAKEESTNFELQQGVDSPEHRKNINRKTFIFTYTDVHNEKVYFTKFEFYFKYFQDTDNNDSSTRQAFIEYVNNEFIHKDHIDFKKYDAMRVNALSDS